MVPLQTETDEQRNERNGGMMKDNGWKNKNVSGIGPF